MSYWPSPGFGELLFIICWVAKKAFHPWQYIWLWGFLKAKWQLTLPCVISVLTSVSHYQDPGFFCHPSYFWPSFLWYSLPSLNLPSLDPQISLSIPSNLQDRQTFDHIIFSYLPILSDLFFLLAQIKFHCVIRIIPWQIMIVLLYLFPFIIIFWAKGQALSKYYYIFSYVYS